ncbi:MAG: hypothetical protein JNM31_04745 [Flavobacteriales bacterium]|nr:hypothetical protein [Flavobacteriales bacterium]
MKPTLKLVILWLALASGIANAQHMQLELNFWRPNGAVFAIAVDSLNNVVYIGGDFTGLTDPQPPYATVVRNRVAALDMITGAPLPWAPDVDGQIISLAVGPSDVYIGGSFSTINGQTRQKIGAVNKLTGLVTSWNPNPGSGALVKAMAITGGQLFVGGQFNTLSGSSRTNAAAFQMSTGALLPWNPAPNDLVLCLTPTSTSMFIGGHFTLIGSNPFPHLAEVDLTNGGIANWSIPAVNMPVRDMALFGSTLFIAGDFTTVGGAARPYAAQLNNGTMVTSWNPQPDAPQTAIAVANGQVYLAGYQNMIGSDSRPWLGAVSALTGIATPWVPNPSGNVFALSRVGERVLCGGSFTSMNGFNYTTNFATLVPEPPAVTLRVFALLEGPFIAGPNTMSDALRTSGVLPYTEPYSAMGYTYTYDALHPMASTSCGGYGGMVQGVMGTAGTNTTVDWAILELRDAVNPSLVVASKRVLIKAGGELKDVNNGYLRLPVPPGNYHVAVRHRNHLGAMTASPVALNSTGLTNVSFSNSALATYGTDARKVAGNMRLLWCGDVTFDHMLKYTGSGNDRDPILAAIGGGSPTTILTGQYRNEDVNMDGLVKYTGASNDRDPILVNIGGSTPTNTRAEQLP